jgi:hypothetical protein
MKYKLVKIKNLSGDETSIYSVFIYNKKQTLYENFIKENYNSFKSEIIDINQRLKTIGVDIGARYCFFKHKEGVPGDGVCALYDNPNKTLRLYCIRYGTLLVIVGGGGEKPKNIRRLQDNEKLTKENFLMRKISKDIQQKMKDGDIQLSKDGLDFEGDLIFNTNNHE